MITQLEVITPRVTTSPLPFADGTEATDPIRILNIDGLGPVAATVNTKQYGSINDEAFIGSSTGKRNIVITVGFNPNWVDQTVESLRKILYQYFMPQNQVTCRFTSDNMVPVQIDGIVETCEPNIFSKDPQMVISIICVKSAFVAVTATVISGTVLPLPDGDPTIIDYEGDLDTGFVLNVVDADPAADTKVEYRLINEAPSLELFIVQATVSPSQYLSISTVRGDKYVRQVALPLGTVTSILGQQSAGSTWLQLKKGINKFRVAGGDPNQAWTLQYFAKYGGL